MKPKTPAATVSASRLDLPRLGDLNLSQEPLWSEAFLTEVKCTRADMAESLAFPEKAT